MRGSAGIGIVGRTLCTNRLYQGMTANDQPGKVTLGVGCAAHKPRRQRGTDIPADLR